MSKATAAGVSHRLDPASYSSAQRKLVGPVVTPLRDGLLARRQLNLEEVADLVQLNQAHDEMLADPAKRMPPSGDEVRSELYAWARAAYAAAEPCDADSRINLYDESRLTGDLFADETVAEESAAGREAADWRIAAIATAKRLRKIGFVEEAAYVRQECGKYLQYLKDLENIHGRACVAGLRPVEAVQAENETIETLLGFIDSMTREPAAAPEGKLKAPGVDGVIVSAQGEAAGPPYEDTHEPGESAVARAVEALLSVFTDGVSDSRIRQAATVVLDGKLTTNEKLKHIDRLIGIPPTASAEQLAKLLGVTKQAVMKTDWWAENRRGQRAAEIERRHNWHRDRAKQYEAEDRRDNEVT